VHLPNPETLWDTNADVSVALLGPKGNIYMHGPAARRMEDNIALASCL
jgi:hypothetical protein